MCVVCCVLFAGVLYVGLCFVNCCVLLVVCRVMLAVSWIMRGVCCSLCDPRRSLFVACCASRGACCSLFLLCCGLSVGYCLLFGG